MTVQQFKELESGTVLKYHIIKGRDTIEYYMVMSNDGKQIWLQSLSSHSKTQWIFDEGDDDDEIECYSIEFPVCIEPRYYIELLGGVPKYLGL